MYLLSILWCINYFTTSLCGEIQSYGNGGAGVGVGGGGGGYDGGNGYNSINSIEVSANNGGYNQAGGSSVAADALKLISNIGYRTTAAASNGYSNGYGSAASTGYSNGGGIQYSGGAVDTGYGGNGGAYIVSHDAGNGLSYGGARYGGTSSGGYGGGVGGYSDSYGSGAQQYGPIPAAIQTTRTYEIRNVNVHSEPPQMQTVVVEPNELPITILFKSASSRLKVSQQHYGSPGSEERTQSEDEPHKLYHQVSKPVIQEVREIIMPYRRIVQEIQPVLEEIQTIVAKGEKRYGGEGAYGADGGYGSIGGGYGGAGGYAIVGGGYATPGGYGGERVVEELVDSGYGGRISGGYGVSSGGSVGYGGNDIGLGVLAYDVSGGGGVAVAAKPYKS